MGDVVLLIGMIVSLLSAIGGVVAAVWHLVTLHWIWMVGDLAGACVAAALVVTFSRVQHRYREH